VKRMRVGAHQGLCFWESERLPQWWKAWLCETPQGHRYCRSITGASLCEAPQVQKRSHGARGSMQAEASIDVKLHALLDAGFGLHATSGLFINVRLQKGYKGVGFQQPETLGDQLSGHTQTEEGNRGGGKCREGSFQGRRN